jgi:hypothetical protein
MLQLKTALIILLLRVLYPSSAVFMLSRCMEEEK